MFIENKTKFKVECVIFVLIKNIKIASIFLFGAWRFNFPISNTRLLFDMIIYWGRAKAHVGLSYEF